MNYIDILRERIEAKKKKFGGKSPSDLTCDEVLGLIQAIPASQQSVHPTALCTCETIHTEITKLLNNACPVHGSHSG